MQTWFFLFLAYAAISWHHLVKSVAPIQSCSPRLTGCFGPLISAGDLLTLELWLYAPPAPPSNETKKLKWVPVESCRFNFTIPNSGVLPVDLTENATCSVPIPDVFRERSTDRKAPKPLEARFMFRREDGRVVSTVPLELTRIVERRPSLFWSGSSATGSRSLLEEPLPKDADKKGKKKKQDETEWVPYLKYGRSPVRIRFVAEDRDYAFLQRADGIVMQPWNRTTYAPTLYIDDLSLQHSSRIELAPPEDNKPPVKIQIKFGSVSPLMDGIIRQAYEAFKVAETLMPGEELDEIRYFLQDERLYRFILTQIISYLHMWFDYLAFRDEIQFYRGRKNLTGVSTYTSITRMVSSIIIFLYLLDGGGTSWVVLLSLFSSCLVDAWKVWKLLRPKFSFKFPFISVRQLETAKEQETAQYDRIATANLAMVLYPLVVGWALYALQHYKYKSWYSWFISNLANVVYTFGFITLCPQLYVNYRLKSVAHLPWKVFIYKIFNTFVDDAFAWIIDMPWKHRIMTLRDDVVFLMFLVQVYLYRVDKSRTNEFGYAYEDEDESNVVEQEKEIAQVLDERKELEGETTKADKAKAD